MLIISFAWTTDAFLAGAKTCTRRNWADRHAQKFITAYRLGALVAAYNKLPRAHGQKVALIYLTEEPFKQRTGLMTGCDYKDEGLAWMEEQGLLIQGFTPRQFFEAWRDQDEEVWVIRFNRFTIPSAMRW